MYSYTYSPPRNVKKCSGMSLAGFAVGFGLMYASTYLPYPFIFQIFGVAFIAIGIFMTTRYIVRRYVYSVQKVSECDYDFSINEVVGSRSKTVCRISTDEIMDLVYSNDGKTPVKYRGKAGKDIIVYDYCQDFLPGDCYYLYADIREGRICIKFSPDERLVKTVETLRPKFDSDNEL